MTWQFNPYAVPLLASALPLVVIKVVAWRQRPHLAVQLFLGLEGAALCLVLAYALELLSADLESMLIWLRFEYLFHSGLVFWPLFALVYSGYETSVTRWRVLGLLIVPAIIVTLVWTNGAHGLIWATTGVQRVGTIALFDRSYGAALWVWLVYLAGMVVAGHFILIRKALRSPGHFRGQATWLALALSLPPIGMVMTVTRLMPVPLLDAVPYSVALACIPLAVALFRYHLFDLIPAAYEQVIESMDDAVIVCDSRDRIVQTNSAAARLTGHTPAQLQGIAVEAVLAGMADFQPEPRAWSAGGPHKLVTVGASANARQLDLNVSPLRDRQGLVTGRVFVLRDITDRMRVERQALDLAVERERVRVLRTFIHDASHDFRTPISIILTSAYLVDKLGASACERLESISQSTPAPEVLDEGLLDIGSRISRMREKAQHSHTSAMRLKKLVESMLEVTQLEDCSQFEFAPHDLNALAGDSLQAYQGEAAGKQLRLTFEPGSLPRRVRVDAYKLTRAVQALVDNAIQYTPTGGVVCVTTYSRADEVVIEVRDTGIGISEADLARIFERFYRVDAARSDATGGAGLGLSIAQRIVQAHGGRIDVESVMGEGATFRIALPAG